MGAQGMQIIRTGYTHGKEAFESGSKGVSDATGEGWLAFLLLRIRSIELVYLIFLANLDEYARGIAHGCCHA